MSLHNVAATSAILTLTDMLGKIAVVQTVDMASGQPAELSLKGLAPGVYMLSAQGGNRLLTARVVVK